MKKLFILFFLFIFLFFPVDFAYPYKAPLLDSSWYIRIDRTIPFEIKNIVLQIFTANKNENFTIIKSKKNIYLITTDSIILSVEYRFIDTYLCIPFLLDIIQISFDRITILWMREL